MVSCTRSRRVPISSYPVEPRHAKRYSLPALALGGMTIADQVARNGNATPNRR